MEIKFMYTIHHPCSGMVWFTCDTEEAERARRSGCIIYCKAMGLNGKIFKHTSN